MSEGHPGDNGVLTVEQLGKARYGNPDQVRQLERESQELRWALNGRSQYDGEPGHGQIQSNPELLKESLARNESSIATMRPPTGLSQIQLGKYHRMEQELTQDIRDVMPTQEMMERPTDQNVQWYLAYNQHYAAKCVALQNIREIKRVNLDPTNNDPFLTSLEIIRPVQPPKNDPRKFNANYDLLRFTDVVERQLNEPDQETFLRFCGLKMLGWTESTMLRELGINKPAYEACMDRLARETGQSPDPKEPEPMPEPVPQPDEEPEPTPAGGSRVLPLQFTNDQLKAKMRALGMPQHQLARLINMNGNTCIGKIQGRNKFSDQERFKVLTALEQYEREHPRTVATPDTIAAQEEDASIIAAVSLSD